MFHLNVGWLSMDYTALYPRRQNSSTDLCFHSYKIKNRECIKPNATIGKTGEKWKTTIIWNSWLWNRGSLPDYCINKCFNMKCVKREERTATMGNVYWLAMEIGSMRKKTDLITKTNKTFPNVMIKHNRITSAPVHRKVKLSMFFCGVGLKPP
jgi:hypothetical protein